MSATLDRSVLICRVQTRLCALPLPIIGETLRPLPVEPLAGPVDHVLGVARIRGQSLPVVDVAALLGVTEPRPARYVTVRVGDRWAALALTAVLGLRALPAASLSALPPLLRDARHEIIDTITWLDAELLAVLNTARLLPDGVPC